MYPLGPRGGEGRCGPLRRPSHGPPWPAELVLWGEEGPYMEAFTFEEFVFAMERFCGTTRDDLIRLIFRLVRATRAEDTRLPAGAQGVQRH